MPRANRTLHSKLEPKDNTQQGQVGCCHNAPSSELKTTDKREDTQL
jgi:hypothetical protein